MSSVATLPLLTRADTHRLPKPAVVKETELLKRDIAGYLQQEKLKEILRFITCGSVDDGKSTLIGRMLHDTDMIYTDQLEALRKDSARSGSSAGELDLSLLVDGLMAEREQGITIDVAYRYFATAKRKFIIADCPGHEQYTRNMVTGASTCDIAVILIDARKGVQNQTRRHTFIANLLGIRHIIVAINKMDLVDYHQSVFQDTEKAYREFLHRLPIDDLRFIPVSAKYGDNVVHRSKAMAWYDGPTLFDLLDSVPVAGERDYEQFRFVVQRVCRSDDGFRGYAGTIHSGVIRPAEEIRVLPSGLETKVKQVVTMDGELDRAFTPMAVTLTLDDDLDVSRGDTIVRADRSPPVQNEVDVTMVWLNQDAPLQVGKRYIVKHGANQIPARVDRIHYRTDMDRLEREAAEQLAMNEIGYCRLVLERPIVFEDYRNNRQLGACILIDKLSNATVGAAMIGETRLDD